MMTPSPCMSVSSRMSIANVDADAEANAPVRRHALVDSPNPALDRGRRLHGAVDAVEDDKERVSGGLANGATVPSDRRVNDLPPHPAQPP